MAKIIFYTASRVIRGPYTNPEPVKAGESEREITAQEELTIDALRAGGAAAVVDDISVGLRAATQDEADEYRSFRAAILRQIKSIANLVTRGAAYQNAPAVLLAMDNGDKPGAKAVVDLMTGFPQAARDRLKALIDLST